MTKHLFHTDPVPMLSTGHVSRDTAKELDKGDVACSWTIVAPYEHGWFIYVQPNEAHDELNVPGDLRAVMEWANTQSLKWVRLDADGDFVDGLATYEW